MSEEGRHAILQLRSEQYQSLCDVRLVWIRAGKAAAFQSALLAEKSLSGELSISFRRKKMYMT
jgi:hypothetical protein